MNVLSKKEYEKMWLSEDYELQIIRAHNKGILPVKLDVDLIKKNLEQTIQECNTGECIGEGWHGGLSSFEWKRMGDYYRQCLTELNEISSSSS